jgi:hypothetical protein
MRAVSVFALRVMISCFSRVPTVAGPMGAGPAFKLEFPVCGCPTPFGKLRTGSCRVLCERVGTGYCEIVAGYTASVPGSDSFEFALENITCRRLEQCHPTIAAESNEMQAMLVLVSLGLETHFSRIVIPSCRSKTGSDKDGASWNGRRWSIPERVRFLICGSGSKSHPVAPTTERQGWGKLRYCGHS